MFSFFKRSGNVPRATEDRVASQVKNKVAGARGLDFLSPLPVPEVTEGNQDSDWAMWEDSVLERDSQVPSQFADTRPSQLDEASADASEFESKPDSDSFVQVSKHAP